MEKSLIDYAFDFVSESKDPIVFTELWKRIVEASGISAEEAANKVGKLYTLLMLDGRFVNLGDNTWDLRSRQTFDKVHIDMNDVYSDVDETDDDIEEGSEEKEYNEVFEEPKDDDDDLGSDEGEENENSEEEGE